MARRVLGEVASTIKQALMPRRPRQRQVIWAIRIVAALAVVIFVLALIGDQVVGYWHVSSDNAAVVGAVLALFGVLIAQVVSANIARSGQRAQQELEDQRARASSLESYLDRMGELSTKHQLHTSIRNDETNNSDDRLDEADAVARAQTMAVLEGLGSDSTRKRILLEFLYESALINRESPVIRLDGAPLRGANLEMAQLRSVNLSGADLIDADLSGAFMNNANLRATVLKGADLQKTNGLTQKQIEQALGDETTQLPDHLHRPAHWSKGGAAEEQPKDG